MIFSVTDPRGKMSSFEGRMRAFDATVRVQREVDEGLRVVWDDQREKFIVLDTKAPGGPDASYVLLVQEPDGSYRPFDQRTIETLLKLRFGHAAAAKELDRIAAEREHDRETKREAMAQDFAQGFKWFGKNVTPSVGWDARSLRREQIRKEAGL